VRKSPAVKLPLTLAGRLALCFSCLAVLSCVDSRWSVCPGGDLACPEGTVCDVVHHRCAESSEPCIGRDDGATCALAGRAGACTAGICEAVPGPHCGDGRVDRGEDCDGEDLNGFTCSTHPAAFYAESGLACGTDCRFDTAACTGACLDGETNGPEVCDPTDLSRDHFGSCVSRGYSAGVLGCLDACDDFSVQRCIQYGWTVSRIGLGTPTKPAAFSDLWGADGQLLATGPQALRWFDGTTWGDWAGGFPAEVRSDPFESPGAIWGSSLSDFWVAFAAGLGHWDGAAWSFTEYPYVIDTLWGSGPDNIFGASSYPAMIHRYDGTTWAPIEPFDQLTMITAIGGSGPTDVYVLADYAAVFHFDGVEWTSLDLGPWSFQSVWASAPDDVWITAAHPLLPSDSRLLHFDGSQWSETVINENIPGEPSGSTLVAGRSRDDVWVTYSGGAMHFDGVGWVRTSGARSAIREPYDFSITGLWVDAASVVIGSGDQVARWDGAGQFDSRGPAGDVSWSDVWGLDSSTWVAVGNNGTDGIAFRENGLGFTDSDRNVWVIPGEFLTHVAGFARDDVYAGGARGSIYHFDGTRWRVVRAAPAGEFHAFRSMQAVGESLYVLEAYDTRARPMDSPQAEGHRFVLSRFDGSAWSTLLDREEPAYTTASEMWAYSPEDVWLLLTDGSLVHFDGREISRAHPPRGVVSIWGSRPDDLHALELARRIWHYDGTGWTATSLDVVGTAFDEVRGRAADDVFLLGWAGEIAHFDGREWESMAPLDLTGSDGFRAIAVMSNVLIAVGDSRRTVDGNGIEGLLRTRMTTCRPCERDQGNRIDDDCDGQTDEPETACEPLETR
jgi:hypothetical protein